MAPRTKGPRLYQLKSGIYAILDAGNRQQSTGTRDFGEAKAALARYIVEQDRAICGPVTPEEMTVAEALSIYAEEHAPTRKDPARIGYAIDALVPLFGSTPIANLTGAACRRYGKLRKRAPGTIRKELGTLQAAINYCHAEGYLTAPRRLRLPSKPPPRDRWLTRDEVARLIEAAESRPDTAHLARFILVAVYTGTRSTAILNLRFQRHTGGGWIDTRRGIMYRRGAGVVETKKRQPPIPLPAELLAHLRQWELEGADYVVDFRGNRVGHVRRAWKRALELAGIEHCTRHDLRRTAITWAMQRGMNRWDAAGYFGISQDMLERVYAHHHPEYLREAADTMSLDLYDGTVSGHLRAVESA